MTFDHVKRHAVTFGFRVCFFNWRAWRRGLSIEMDFWKWYFGVFV